MHVTRHPTLDYLHPSYTKVNIYSVIQFTKTFAYLSIFGGITPNLNRKDTLKINEPYVYICDLKSGVNRG